MSDNNYLLPANAQYIENGAIVFNNNTSRKEKSEIEQLKKKIEELEAKLNSNQ